MSKLNYYVALLHKEPESVWGIQFPDFPGCISAGETFAQALAMGAEALASNVAVAREFGDTIPVPRSLDEIRASGGFAEELEDAILTMIPLLPASGQPIAISVSMDRALLAAIDRHAQLTGRTRSALFAEGAQLILLSRVAARKKKAKGRKRRSPAARHKRAAIHAKSARTTRIGRTNTTNKPGAKS